MNTENNREKIIDILNDKVYKVPFFPGQSGTAFDPDDMKYNELSWPENKTYYIAQYGDDLDIDREIEIDYDKLDKTIGERFISILTEDGLPPWIEKMTYSHISMSCNYSAGDLYANIKFTKDVFEKILSFLANNFYHCEQRIKELYHSSYNDKPDNIVTWIEFFGNPYYVKSYCESVSNEDLFTMIMGATQMWYELNFDCTGYNTITDKLVCWTLEDLYVSEFLYYKPDNRLNDEIRQQLKDKNRKMIEDNGQLNYYNETKERFNKCNK